MADETRPLHIRVTPALWTRAKAAADGEGIRVSELVRSAIRNECARLEAAAQAANLDPAEVARWRDMLSREPTVRGMRA